MVSERFRGIFGIKDGSKGGDARNGLETKPRVVGKTGYLFLLKRQFNISRIYYPGCWNDDQTLRHTFKPEEIYYIDNDEDTIPSSGMRNFAIADMKASPFADGTFDAIFIQDVHNTQEEFSGALQALKPGGLVIFSDEDCGQEHGMQIDDFEQHPALERLSLEYATKYYTAFKKRFLPKAE